MLPSLHRMVPYLLGVNVAIPEAVTADAHQPSINTDALSVPPALPAPILRCSAVHSARVAKRRFS